MHSLIRTLTRICIRTSIRTFIRTFIRTLIRTFIRTFIRTLIPTLIRTLIPTFIRTFTRTLIRTFICTFIRTLIRTLICTLIRTLAFKNAQLSAPARELTRNMRMNLTAMKCPSLRLQYEPHTAPHTAQALLSRRARSCLISSMSLSLSPSLTKDKYE